MSGLRCCEIGFIGVCSAVIFANPEMSELQKISENSLFLCAVVVTLFICPIDKN